MEFLHLRFVGNFLKFCDFNDIEQIRLSLSKENECFESAPDGVLHLKNSRWVFKNMIILKYYKCTPPAKHCPILAGVAFFFPNGLRHTRSAGPRDGPRSWCEEPPPGVAENHVLLPKLLWSCLRQDKKNRQIRFSQD